MTMNVLILDMVHGGEILAEEYLRRGHSVNCVDVYGIVKEEMKEELNKIGVITHDKVPTGHYDLLLMPVHCPDVFLNGVTYDERNTFHEAVGELCEGTSRIEITGVKGKTSCCYLLAHILSLDGRTIFLHTSRGQGPWREGEHIIERKMSIAPPSILKLPKDYDTVIAEVSLGGSGKAEITMITNLAEDYGIAAGTRKASDAKASIFSNGTNIVSNNELAIWSRYYHGLTSYGGRVSISERIVIGTPTKISIDYDGQHELFLSEKYLHLQYIETIEAVLEICHAMNVPVKQVITGLEAFGGVPGRGEIQKTNEGWTIIERNPGISYLSVKKTLDTLERMNLLEDAAVTLDPVNHKVCEKMDVDQIRNMAESKGAEFHLTGDENGIPSERKLIVNFIKEGYQ